VTISQSVILSNRTFSGRCSWNPILEAHPGDDDHLPGYHVRHIHRFDLGTGYLQVVDEVCLLLERPPLKGQCQLVLDLTGVGRPVGELFIEAGLRPIGVTITGGVSWHRERRDDWHVAKSLLVSLVQKFLSSERLVIAKSLPHAGTLKKELRDFRVKISKSANETYEAREGAHDDLLLSLCVGLFVAEHPGQRFLPVDDGR
jgi:hypothetical protein